MVNYGTGIEWKRVFLSTYHPSIHLVWHAGECCFTLAHIIPLRLRNWLTHEPKTQHGFPKVYIRSSWFASNPNYGGFWIELCCKYQTLVIYGGFWMELCSKYQTLVIYGGFWMELCSKYQTLVIMGVFGWKFVVRIKP
jgi:hypothetical protein